MPAYLHILARHGIRILLFTLYYALHFKILLTPRPAIMECGNPFLGEALVVLFLFAASSILLTIDLVRNRSPFYLGLLYFLLVCLPPIIYFVMR